MVRTQDSEEAEVSADPWDPVMRVRVTLELRPEHVVKLFRAPVTQPVDILKPKVTGC